MSACIEMLLRRLRPPCAIETASRMCDDKFSLQSKVVACFDNIVRRRNVEVPANMMDRVVQKKIVRKKQFDLNWMKLWIF
jgi:hypothetical protein